MQPTRIKPKSMGEAASLFFVQPLGNLIDRNKPRRKEAVNSLRCNSVAFNEKIAREKFCFGFMATADYQATVAHKPTRFGSNQKLCSRGRTVDKHLL